MDWRKLATLAVLSTLLAGGALGQEETLALGGTWTGRIVPETPRVRAGSLPLFEIKPTRGVKIALELPPGIEATLHLRSLEVDPYLVVLDAQGELVGEDDNGGDGLNARVHLPAQREGEPAAAYLCAMNGEVGSFEAVLEPGPPADRDLSAKEMYERNFDDTLARLEHLAAQGRSRSTAAALARDYQGRMLGKLERFDEAVVALQDTIALLEELRGSEDPLLVRPLNSLAVVWLSRGRRDEALPLLERAEELGTSHLPERHALMASVLSNMAGALNRDGPTEGGLAMQRRALIVAEETYGPRSLDAAIMRTNLGVTLARLERFDEAEAAYLAALEALEPRGDEDPATLRCLNNLVRLEIRRDRVEQAGAWLDRVLAAIERSDRKGTLSHANALFRLSLLRQRQGRYHQALSASREALALIETIQGPQSTTVLQWRYWYAEVLCSCRRTEEAREVLESLVDDLKGASPRNTLQADVRICQARLARAEGDLAQAVRLREEALRLREALYGAESSQVASVLMSLSVDLRLIGDIERAEECAKRAVAAMRSRVGADHEDTLRAEIQLASLDRRQKRYSAARARLDAVLTRVAGKSPYLDNIARQSAGALAFEQGRDEDALEHFQRAIEVLVEAGQEPSATAKYNLGSVLRTLGRTQEALAALHAAKEQAEREDRPTLPMIQLGIVRTLLVAGRDEEAWIESLAMIRDTERLHDGILRELLEYERHRFLEAQREQLDQHVSLAADRPDRSAEAIDAVLRWKGRIARSLRRSRADLFGGIGEEADPTLAELRTLKGQLADLFWAAKPGDRERHLARMEELRDSLRDHERKLLENAPPASTITAGVAELARSLADEESLVVFFVHEPYARAGTTFERASERLIAWIVRSAGFHRVDLGESEEIRLLVLPYLESLRGLRGTGVGLSADDGDARRVAERLWAPLAPHLEGVEHITICPDRFLNLLPLGTLVDSEDRFLLERFSMSITDGPLSRLYERPPSSAAPALLVVGDVDYDPPHDGAGRAAAEATHRTRVRDTWAPLRHTAEEIRAVRSLHRTVFGESPACTSLSGQAASVGAVRAALQEAGVAHLATHGFFDPAPVAASFADGRIEFVPIAPRVQDDSPGVLAGLVLAGANARASADGDGFLTAEELAWLDLRSADLVVLSACETGLGKPWPGEGMASLRSAFHSAGARTVVSSLWSVSDQETAELMESFYRGLWVDKLASGEALRRAQLEALARNRLADRGPRTGSWGAFVLSGAWD